MAEFCKDCARKILGLKSKNLVLSDYVELCEGCGKYKRVVVRVDPVTFGQRIRNLFKK